MLSGNVTLGITLADFNGSHRRAAQRPSQDVYQSSIALPAQSRWLGSYLRAGHCLLSRVGVWGYLWVRVQPTDHKIGFEFRQREIFPFLSLAQERGALRGTEGRFTDTPWSLD